MNKEKLGIHEVSGQFICSSQAMDDVYRLAFQQAALHAENLHWLPDVPEEGKQRIALALKEDRLEAGVLNQAGEVYAGLILLSPLWMMKEGSLQSGMQMDDVIVDKAQRGRNLGQYAISYAAFQSSRKGGRFLGWECEEGNSASKVYEIVGAHKRREKPFRLAKEDIDKIKSDGGNTSIFRVESMTDIFNKKAGVFPTAPGIRDPISNLYDSILYDENGFFQAGCLVSQRISVLRTLGYKPDGIHEESPTGYQIESIDFSKNLSQKQVDIAAVKLIDQTVGILRKGEKGCDFVDIVGYPQDRTMLTLAEHYGAAVTSYTGSPSTLWMLDGSSFKKAAMTGAKLELK